MEKNAHSRKSTAAAARREDVARRYLRKEHQADIARVHGVSQPMISKDMKIIRAGWLASRNRDFETVKAEELQKLDQVEAAAWIEFASSALESTRSRAGRKVSVTTETHARDRGWLHTILGAMAQRAKLLGLDEPQRYAVNFDTLTEHQLMRLAAGEPARDVLTQPAQPPSMAEA